MTCRFGENDKIYNRYWNRAYRYLKIYFLTTLMAIFINKVRQQLLISVNKKIKATIMGSN